MSLSRTLAEASRAYRRRDDDAFRRCLLAAVRLAPERLDIRNCLANHYIQTDRPDLAIEAYEAIHALVPTETENLFRLAHWLRFAGDSAKAEELRNALATLRPSMADDLDFIWRCLDRWFARPVTDVVPEFPGASGRPAILLLGYVLADDGAPQPELLARLEKTKEAADKNPAADIIVSGGVPRAGRVEADVMRERLEARGIAPGRIHGEGSSRDVIENLVYSRHILAINKYDAVLLVTSSPDVRRAGAGLEIMAAVHGDSYAVRAVASSPGDDVQNRLKTYRDALRAFGIPMMAAYPELAER